MPVQRPSSPARSASSRSSKQAALRPANRGRRIRREKRAIAAMCALYCRAHHAGSAEAARLCGACEDLLRYAHQRLDQCVFGELKQPCDQCATDCYSKTQRPRLRAVMRYAEPRLRWRHPLLSLLRLIDKWRAR
ncbi:hypothetical protein CCR82_11690 [Halochromatium salexigens]|uniref:Nitrous oxide-stimulated promoter family protein n=2 Tax=Halochromatium salexigens TaxID=49447 RepID=A0AAJ0XFN2_HALSE|nr:hypothetical protein [Halochromatium salexigens]